MGYTVFRSSVIPSCCQSVIPYVTWFVPLNILRTNWWILTKFCICIDIDKIKVGIVTHQFSQIWKSYCHWLTSELRFWSISWKWTDEFWQHYAFALIWCWHHLACDDYTTNLQHSYGLWLMSEFRFCLISWIRSHGFLLHFAPTS